MDTIQKHKAERSPGWKELVILSCLGLTVIFVETLILPAVPDFVGNFDISHNTSSWLLSSYMIAGALMTPIAGKLSEIYGSKKLLLIIMALYTSSGIFLQYHYYLFS
jgi:MFS family permease